MRPASSYRAARRNACRHLDWTAVGITHIWRAGREVALRNDGFRYGWHQSMPQPRWNGVPAVLIGRRPDSTYVLICDAAT